MSLWPWRRHWFSGGTMIALLGAAGCGGDGSSDPQIPADITLNAADVTLDAEGQVFQLTATVVDEDGDRIPDASVAWESGDEAVVEVSSTGLLTGQGPGTAEVSATSGEVTTSAQVIVESIASLALLEGNGQTAPFNTAVPTPPAVQVRDGSNLPVANVRVRFTAASGSGSVTGELQTTDADGIARVGAWRLGDAGINTLTASVEDADLNGEPVQFLATTAATGYNITV